MKLIIGLFTVLIAIVILANVSKKYFKNHPFFGKTPNAVINEQTFNLYLAKSRKDLEVGLSNRNSMPANYGMLFIFNKPGLYPFWMKNMKFPIDIIYIDKNQITQVFNNLKPPKTLGNSFVIYKPQEVSDMVLEINAGLSKKYNFKKGDIVKIENL